MVTTRLNSLTLFYSMLKVILFHLFIFLLCPKVNYIVLLSEFFHVLLLVM